MDDFQPSSVWNQPTEKVVRRLCFPVYDEIFPLWMCEEIICKEFLRLFATQGRSVTLVGKPKPQDTVNIGKGVRGVRFDIVAETGGDLNDFHIYCVDSQLSFDKDSYIDRELYYGCVAVATKSLKVKESFEQLRPVTVIFIYIDNIASASPIDFINLYRRRDIEAYGNNARLYTGKLNFIDINLNNKANWEKGGHPMDSDIQAFMDLMSLGDNEHLVELILAKPELSDSTREAIKAFSSVMKNKIQEMDVDESKYPPHLDEILQRDEFKLTAFDLAVLEGEKRGRLEGKIELYYTELRLSPHDIARRLKIEESEVEHIVKELKLVQ